MAGQDRHFVTVGLGEDDAARALKLPGTDISQEDGGQSYEQKIQYQNGRKTAGFNTVVLSSHFDLARLSTNRHERDPFASYELYAGRALHRSLSHGTSLLAYGQADLDYSDTRLIPGIHNWVHRNLTGGRDMGPLYAASRVPNGFNAGVSGMAEVRADRLHAGGIAIQPAAFAAAAIGNDRLEGGVGAGLTIGHRPDGTPRALPNANPEAPAVIYVRDPAQFQQGSWSLTANYSRYRLQDNRYLKAGEPERKDVGRLAVEAVVNVRDHISLGAGYELYDNPVQRLPRLTDNGPSHCSSFKARLTVGF